ncbi:hypothetical protein SEA_SIXAMA_59 [Gordonia phage Sixama]|uniref:Uncharacterized protein n=1 Tax=Gordonia phage Sixama TaxID=2653271 RepID=A0A5Q2F1T9_9CAUD|nr:hypothetical protein PP302_gp059 [Gordonia phage Sixama]QGF20238.1 hypothetical protein SEA_SIXAMA_59 [Gordonia phage Sixama]
MPAAKTPRYRIGDNVVLRDDQKKRVWHVWGISPMRDDQYKTYYEYRIHTQDTPHGGTEYREVRGAQIKLEKRR